MSILFFYSSLLLATFFLFQIRYTLDIAFADWGLAQYLLLALLAMYFLLCFIKYHECKNILKSKHSSLETAKKKIRSMDPSDLSKLITNLFQTTSTSKVYSTPKTNTPFYDIEMDLADEKLIISCLLMEHEQMITQAYLDRLYNLMRTNQVPQGAFITLSDFSDECYDFIKDKPIHLINGDELVNSMNSKASLL